VKTIRRNAARKIAALAEATMQARAYDLGNDFHPAPVPVETAMTNLAAFDFAKLYDYADGSYTIHVHSNKWYRLFTAEYFQGLGRAAYAKPNPIAAPAADGKLTVLFRDMPVGSGADAMMLEWQAGWNAAADEAAAAILAEEV
jgi:hypothetical protein